MTAPTVQQGQAAAAAVAAGATSALSTVAAVGSYVNLMAATRQQILVTLARMWAQLGSYRDADAQRFLVMALPFIQAGQQHASALTSAYLSRTLSNLAGQNVPVAISSSDVTGTALRGVDPVDVYMRPFQQVWTELSQGRPLVDAVRSGVNRLNAIAATDLQLATTRTAQATLSTRRNVVGYRRVLTGAENCGLCVVASTQRYHKADLLPIHPRCDCVVAPIIGDEDPGQVINSAMLTEGSLPTQQNRQGVDVYSSDHLIDLGNLLPDVHAAIKDAFGKSSADSRTAIDYRHVITVHHHGEIGPVLTVKGQTFSGPSAIH